MAEAWEVVNVSRNAAALGLRGGGASALPIDLGVLGGEGARVTALTAMAVNASEGGQKAADHLAKDPQAGSDRENAPAAEEKAPPEQENPAAPKVDQRPLGPLNGGEHETFQ